MPRLQLWGLAELWTLHQLQQCAINFAPQHRAYQNTLLRPASKYRSNLGVCQNTAGASGLPDGASRLSGACASRKRSGRCRSPSVKQRRVWFWAGLGATAPLGHYIKAELGLGTVPPAARSMTQRPHSHLFPAWPSASALHQLCCARMMCKQSLAT